MVRLRLLITLIPLVIFALPAQAASPDQNSLRAAFILNFLRYTEIPLKDQSSIALCISSSSSEVVEKYQTIAGKSVNDAEVRVASLASSTHCDVRYLPRGTTQMKGMKGLVICEERACLETGGHIRFYTEQDKLRFEVNLTAVKRDGLKMSSKLLGLAKIFNEE